MICSSIQLLLQIVPTTIWSTKPARLWRIYLPKSRIKTPSCPRDVESTIGEESAMTDGHLYWQITCPALYAIPLTAKSRCVKQSHLQVCAQCKEPWSLKHNTECPCCLGAKNARARRLAKVEEEIVEDETKGNYASVKYWLCGSLIHVWVDEDVAACIGDNLTVIAYNLLR